MLDDPGIEGPLSDNETRGAREQLLEPAEDIASLIITQDSSELLEVAGATSSPATGPPSLELEDEPSSDDRSPESYGHALAVGAPVGMSRTTMVARKRRSPIPMVIGLGVAAWIAYFLYSKVPVSTELIESAEAKIAAMEAAGISVAETPSHMAEALIKIL